MTILKVLTAPDPILTQVASPVSMVDQEVRTIMQDMVETMYEEGGGIGLAGNQVGILKRIIVLDLQEEGEKAQGIYPLLMANPEIIERSAEQVAAEEGCLSIPDQTIKVQRCAAVTVKYLDHSNQEQVLDATGWLARAIQHEVDHLDGKLLVDYLSNLKKNVAIRKLRKLKRAA